MRRDPDIIREVLIQIEADGGDPMAWVTIDIPGASELEISYHVEMLDEAGFIHATDCSSMDGHSWIPSRLTWDGHELLDTIQDENIWSETKKRVSEAGGWTLPILQAIATDILKKQIGLD